MYIKIQERKTMTKDITLVLRDIGKITKIVFSNNEIPSFEI